MKLTKKLEAEVLKAYNTVWDAYLKGDMKTFASMLDENCYIIGSAAGEVFSNKKAAVKYYKSTAEQITGKAEFRNRKIKVMPVEKGFMVNEETDFYFLIDGQWTFYGPARISSLFHKKNNKWKVIHQHGSFPDSKTEEGEQVNTDKIKAENIQLRDAVKRRTIELEEKNRELEIEAALERVRTRAMSMQHSDELGDLVATVFKELTALGFTLTSSIIWIHDHHHATDTLWIASAKANKPAKPFHIQPFHNSFFRSITHARKVRDQKWTFTLKGQAKKAFEKAFFKEIPDLPDALRKALINPKQVVFSASFNNFGGLEIVETEALTDEKFDILHRFGKVFDLSYTRFNDLKKAEAQAREAQIEAALEKVRAQAMAMHDSQELKIAAALLFKELKKLGLSPVSCGYSIVDEKNGMCTQYEFNEDGSINQNAWSMSLTETEVLRRRFKSWKKNEPLHVEELEGETNILHHRYVAEKTANFPLTTEQFLSSIPNHVVFYTINFTQGYLIIVTGEKFSSEIEKIAVRFGKVFEQTYTRFLDLQKAEAQAREAQIEAAMERVRSRSMGMQKSDELAEVVAVLYKQFEELDFGLYQVLVSIYDKKNNIIEWWSRGFSEIDLPQHNVIPIIDHPFSNDLFEKWENGVEYYPHILDGELKKSWDEYLFTKTDLKNFPKEVKDTMRSFEKVYLSDVFMKYGSLQAAGPTPLPDDKAAILKRFVKVLDHAYTRMTDLQTAELQTREAQIELGLERVRSRAMAMHTSSELKDVARELRTQLGLLGTKELETCAINLYGESSEFIHALAATRLPDSQEEITESDFLFPKKGITIIEEILQAYSSGVEECVILNEGAKSTQWMNVLAKALPDVFALVAESTGFNKTAEIRVWWTCAFFQDGSLVMITMSPPDETSRSLLKRFALVFGMAYRRFADLKKAEAQAREAQIEVALERVRSRSMAMHHSNDLQEVIKVVTDQLLLLGFKFNTANFAKVYADGSWDLWLSTPEQSYPDRIFVPYFDHKIFNQLNDIIVKGLDSFTDAYGKEEAKKFFRHFFENTIAKNAPESRKQFVLNSKGFARSLFLMKDLWLSIGNYEGIPYTAEENAVFKRFAKVFEQAYTRFLDLQKAEAQTRESEIELALERVRAKTMAMQKPSEFVDVINIVGEQFVHLGFDIEWVNFGANGLDVSEGIHIWNFAVIPGNDPLSARVFIPYFDHPVFIKAVEGLDEYRKTGTDLFIIAFGKEDKDHWLDHLFTKTVFKDVPGEYRSIQYEKPGYTTSNLALKDTWLSIGKFDVKNFTDEQHAILRRFGKAFGQAYTRFLDLQKAEAQSRESQIELGLERVRARAMAMQNSDELKELIGTVFIELTKLDLVLTRCLIVIFDPKTNGSTWWMANSEAPSDPIGLYVKYHEHPPYLSYVKAWQERNLKWQYILEGKDKKGWDDFLFVETELSHLPDFVIAGMKAPDRVYLNASFNSFGNLTLASLEPLSNEHFDILLRFAKVFDLTYTRFNDLKQAESQARESQIQLALERVRARTMAMQRSDELSETSFLLFQQFRELGSDASQISIGIINERENIMEMSATIDGSKMDHVINVSLDEPVVMKKLVAAWKEQKRSLVIDISGDELLAYNNYRNSIGTIKFETKAGDHWVVHIAFFSKGMISFSSHERHTADTIELLERFAGVFDLTYTRFLDLKQAEGQAKEAKIEAALERVRSRTMAMHQTSELQEVIHTVHKELLNLNLSIDGGSFVVINEDVGPELRCWGAGGTAETSEEVQVPHFNMPFCTDLINGIKRGPGFFTEEFSQKEKKEYFTQLFKHKPWSDLNDEQKKETLSSPGGYTRSIAVSKYTSIFIINHHGRKFTEAENDILRRFAKVFEQTYTRFLDLKKAEAQAREAQIELALERVRARTMAMHRSEELAETAQVMFHQLQELGGVPDRIAIGVVDESAGVVNYWTTDQTGSHIDKEFQARLNERTVLSKTYQAWKDQKKSLVVDLHGDDVKEWIKFAREEMGVFVKDEFIKDRRVHSFGFYSHGWILVTTHEPQSAETIQILERFASVFNLTYRRFLDLQKAEAQAREARIEIALERIRARALAMHKSDELMEVARVVWEQMTLLGQRELESSVVHLYEEDPDYIHSYRTVSINPDSNTTLTYGHMAIPKNSCEVVREWVANFRSDLTEYTIEISGAKQQEWYELLFKLAPDVVNSMRQKGDIHEKRYYRFSKFSGGALLMVLKQEPSEEASYLQKRAAVVFDLAYRRFSDLQKAEAQGREAQIEAALERVRSSSLAMHKSEELKDVVKVVFENFRSLGLQNIDSVNINIFHEGSQDFDLWLAAPGQDYTTNFRLPYLDHPIANDFFNAVKKRETIHKGIYDHDSKNKYFEYMFENSDNKHLPEERKKLILNGPAYSVATGIAKHSSIFIHNYNGEAFSEEANGILVRFSKVFDQAYTRFLDLEKAEAQAREAQIEGSLERVRSKTMAMHKSEELPGAATLLFHQLQILGMPAFAAGYCIWSEDKQAITLWMSSEGVLQPAFKAPTTEDELFIQMRKGYEDGRSLHVVEMGGEELVSHYRYMRTLPVVGDIFNSILEAGHQLPVFQVMHYAYFSKGFLLIITYEPVPDAHSVFKRFAAVFDQTYTRFLDLQKAEAQAREAQIEASLERVRSKTMAMHNSQDVGETVTVMFDELRKLDVETLRCGVGIMQENYQMELWTARPDATGKAEFIVGNIDMKLHPLLTGGYEAWKNRAEGFFYQLKDEDLKTYFEAINSHQAYAAKYDISSLPSLMFHYEFNFNEGCLFAFSIKQFSDESSQIFKRFTGVFGQTYRRFLDLQKAEANAREAQIEAGLERVRAKAMAMHSSKDLAETLSVFYRELKSLSVVPIRCGVALMDKETRMAELTTMNTTGEGDSIEIIGKIKMAGHPVLDGVFESWLVQKEYHAVLRGNQIKEYYQVLKPQIDYLDYSHDEAQFGYYFMFNEGDVYAWTEKELTEDELTIYRRFTTVISLTYKRYKDLQQAEAQAREAKIEAGLERVRARTMAMHSSDDVSTATATMFTELEKLGIENLRGGITIIKAGNKQEVWGVTNLPDGRTIRSIGEFDMHLHPLWRELLKAKNDNGDYNYYRLAGKDKEDYIKILNATPNYLSQPIKEFPDVHVQSYFFGEGAIWTNSLQPHSEEDKQVMKRFASVFSLTFRRYQDLKKAEAQAREATIEAALEKVRGKAMAMHNSNDLSTTASIVFTELRKLGISPIRCGVGLLNKESRKGQIYAAASSGDEDSLSLVGWVQLSGHPVLEKIYDTWKNNEDYFPELNGEQMKTYYDLLLSGLSVSVPDIGEKQYGTFLPFSVGCLYAWSETPYNDSELKILKRFASIIDLTFRRYIELQKSEATAKEAIKQAALDRIRADIASMRTINDLDRITPLIWNELTVLGIPFIRCGVFIMDEDHQLIHTFLSTPDGKAIAAFHLPYDTPGNLRNVVSNWQLNKNYIDHWDETEFIQFADILVKGGALVSAEQYLKTIPKGGFYLHFLPFLQGMLYVGNTTQLKQEEIELIQHVADAFSTAYARYEDFNKLEAAKQQVEKTLTDLKQAQTQLVQSEKMASLGEMTAGIAHEIQNPLNFVNNFSEVSKELLDEMKTELETGNTEDAKDIADDVIQNLEKINHHGKRADAIVKSMLQHSRSSSGKKEPADINALADEYLRLAYHGLRAKDKSFNAKFETAFDDSIGKINIISQDIGRVLVNLINNAFYAVSERKKQESNGYEPTVEVLTKKMDDKVEIKVKDNGNGIPQKVLDKIFQPFFTTKPTGQGTGLGLSLAYDIITKGHGGELKVETKEGEGTIFIIQIPDQKS